MTDVLTRLKSRRARIESILTSYGVPFSSGARRQYFKTDKTRLKDLKVAAVADDFTLGNFREECRLFELTGGNWKNEIDEFAPDLVFVESAWNGKDGTWYKKIANGSAALLDMTAYARSKNIPVVFWNKEDPVWTDVFMSAASCADLVFTTDFDCIEKYKRTLRHDNVFFLPFSAQPRIHNPVEKFDRKDKFCFAGAYYHRYAGRARVFDAFAREMSRGKGLEIYDRNLRSARPELKFPSQYDGMVVGTLSSGEIDRAYKGYNYNVNMNSVTGSQTMFARRVFELLASNTVCVGNYARGVRNVLGDLTIATDDPDELNAKLDAFCGTEEKYRRYRLEGLRRVLSEHLCEDRLGYIAECVFGKDIKEPLPRVTIVSPAGTEAGKKIIKEFFDRQTYNNKRLVFIDEAEPGFRVPDDELVGAFLPGNDYGENYITDLALSVRYIDKAGYGKPDFGRDIYSQTYRPCGRLNSASGLFRGSVVEDMAGFASGTDLEGDFFCADEFSFNEREVYPDPDIPAVYDTGIPMDRIRELAAGIRADNLSHDFLRLTPADLNAISDPAVRGLTYKIEGSKYLLTATRGGEQTMLFNRTFTPEELFADGGLRLRMNCEGKGKVTGFCVFEDASGRVTGRAETPAASQLIADVPAGTVSVRLGVRLSGSFAEFSDITAGEIPSGDTPFLSRSNVALLADRYPDYGDVYNYMFLHRRALRYLSGGLVPDVLSVAPGRERRFREYEGVNVTEGDAGALVDALENGSVDTVCVHFVNRYLWDVLKNYLDKIRVIIWSHGSDIQPFERRAFNYTDERSVPEAKKQSDERMALWREIFRYSEDRPVSFVFVSQTALDWAREDYGVDLTGRASVIHNYIDGELFSYEPKDAAQRFEIMSVKSFSAKTYANDVTRQAILDLSGEPEFGSMRFDLFGDGERFETDTAGLEKFPNVRLHRGFLTQAQIAAEHKKHGVYIATTRSDTQGVSRDEAMASGLVPVANAVAAVPEFTDDSCCMLCPAEDHRAVAEAILKLVRDPELFLSMSRRAAQRVREISPYEKTIGREIEVINGK